MSAYWIAVASAEHVRRGRKDGFMQVNHGKPAPLRRVKPGDGIVYYSPTTILRRPAACGSAPDCILVSAILFFLRCAGPCQFTLARDGLHPRNVPPQPADLFQALGLSHVELELQLEQLVAQLMLLVLELGIGQVSDLFCVHNRLLAIRP